MKDYFNLGSNRTKDNSNINVMDTVEIIDITTRGGVARLDGKAIFVPHTVPGDIVEVDVLADKGRYLLGELIRVVTASSDRMEPPCPCFPACGGCDALEVRTEALRRYKLRALKETLARFGGISPDLVEEIRSVGDYQGSRNKITFHLEFSQGKPIWGFHQRGTHKLVAVEECCVEEVGCRQAREDLFAWAEPARLLGWGCKKVMVRAGTGSQQTVLFLPRPQWQTVRAAIPSGFGVNGLWLATPEGKRWELAGGEAYLPLRIGEITYQMRGGTFFQVHSGVAGLLLEDVLASVTGGETFLDLYCGLGFFALPAAPRYHRVVGIESDQEAVADGKRMVEILGLSGVELLPGRIEERLPHLGLGLVDAVVVDPPRSGMEPKALDSMLELNPKQILYVSCHPSALARDLVVLQNQNYRIDRITAYDMFPATLHVETLARLARKA